MVAKIYKNKKGWIKIMEAFIAILIIMVFILIIITQSSSTEEVDYDYILNKELIILREIQLDDSLRLEILDATAPLNWEDEDFPSGTKSKIIEKTPSTFDCVAELCLIDESCTYADAPDQNVFTKSIVISSNLNTYDPKQLKLFCWEE